MYLDKDDVKNEFLRMRVSKNEKTRILAKIESEFGGDSFSNCNRIMWGIEPLGKAGAPKGNQNKRGKKGANQRTKK